MPLSKLLLIPLHVSIYHPHTLSFLCPLLIKIKHTHIHTAQHTSAVQKHKQWLSMYKTHKTEYFFAEY